MSAPPVEVETERITKMIGALAIATQLAADHRAIAATLTGIIEPPASADLKGLLSTIEQIVGLEEQVVKNELGVQQLREALAEAEHDIHTLLRSWILVRFVVKALIPIDLWRRP